MNKKTTSSYDLTKKMLNTLRNLNENKRHNKTLSEGYEIPDYLKNSNKEDTTQQPEPNEQNAPLEAPKDNILVINDVEVKIQSNDEIDLELTDEQKTTISEIIDTFRQQVSQIVNLEPGFSVSPTQIRLDGEMEDMDLRFTYVAGAETGLYMSSDMAIVDQRFLEIVPKMSSFYKMYVDALSPLITQRQNN